MLTKNISLQKLSLAISAILMALWFAFSLSPAASAAQVRNLCQGASFEFSAPGDHPCANGTDASGNPVSAADSAHNLVVSVINVVSIIVGVAAVIMIIYAGFRFVTSAGNPETTKTARNTILYAIVGLLVVAFAQIIVKFVLGKVADVT